MAASRVWEGHIPFVIWCGWRRNCVCWLQLCMVTMALFKTLVELNCEDVMYQLVFRYETNACFLWNNILNPKRVLRSKLWTVARGDVETANNMLYWYSITKNVNVWLKEWWFTEGTSLHSSCIIHHLFPALLWPCRHLIPCSHVMVSQRRSVRELDMYGKTAEKLLALRPNCCKSTDKMSEIPQQAQVPASLTVPASPSTGGNVSK